MRWSNTFIPTLRDDPADAEAPSHVLMLRAGLIRQLGAGRYSCFCASSPQRSSALATSVFCTSTRTATEGSPREVSSTASTARKKLPPALPH